MAEMNLIYETPITPEDVLLLRQLERARNRYHQLSSESYGPATNVPIQPDGPERDE
jgi:hypothetical protein